MRRYIVLLLITGIVWAQTHCDKLVLKNGKEYLGEYVKTEKKMVYFKSQKEMSIRITSIRDVQTLQLKDGTLIKTKIEKLTPKEIAVYEAKKDAIRDAGKWVAYPFLALFSSSGLGTATFFICEDGFKMRDESALISAAIVGSLGLVGSYNFFSKLDKKNIEGKNTEDIELYQKSYYKEFKDKKLKNIVIGSCLLGLTTGIGFFIFLSIHPFGPWGPGPIFTPPDA